MKRTIEVTYSRSFKMNKGNYEQESPMWSQKSILELNGESPEQIEEIRREEFNRLKTLIDGLANDEWNSKKAELANLRLRIKDGKKYPSATCILQPDPISQFIDPEYAIRGKEIHRLFSEWLFTGKWQIPQEPLQKLKYEDIKYQDFFQTFEHRLDFKDSKVNIEVFNEKHLYSGEIDLLCKVDGIPSLVDLKTGAWDWLQVIAYYKAHNSVKQLAIFDLKNQKLETLSLTDKKCPDYWEKFLIKRGEFKARFGL